MNCIETWLEDHVSEKRRIHTYGVVGTAKELAKRYGADAEKAETAALYHDMFRSSPDGILNQYVDEFRLGEEYRNNANLSHGKIAAAVMERDWGITDRDILNAVRYHTTGRAGMSPLEKVIFLADAIEPGRDYPQVETLRKLSEESLDQACLFLAERSIDYIKERGLFLHEDTIRAKDDFKEKEKQMDYKRMAIFAAKVLEDKKARDIVIINIGTKTTFADYMVLASGSSQRQIGTLSEELEEKFEQEAVFVRNIEGKKESGWILMDYSDIVINLLTAEMREKYDIEKVWGDCEFINLEDENGGEI